MGRAAGDVSLDELRRELRGAAEPDRARTLQRFFKTGPGQYGEGDVFIGVPVPASRKIARRFANLETDDVLRLLHSPVHEERLVALVILVRRYDRGNEAVRKCVYDLYLRSTGRVNNWDLVDISAPQIVGAHLLDRSREILDRLARSPSVWERRISIMSTFAFIRAGDLDDTLRLARILMQDRHDLIHKASGWMLREVGKRDEDLLVRFLNLHASMMPRTMLRYSIEKLDPETRLRLMRST